MAGHKKLSGKQEEIRFKVSLCLCKYVSPKTGSLRNRLKAYAQVTQELGQVFCPDMLGTFGGITRMLLLTPQDTILRSHSSTRRYQEDPDAFLLKSYMHGLGWLNGIFARTLDSYG